MKQRWHKEIKAWANGAEIEVHRGNGVWVVTPDPRWMDDCSVYRVKVSKTLVDLQAVLLERDVAVQNAQGQLEAAQAARAHSKREYEWALHEEGKWACKEEKWALPEDIK